MLRKIAFGAGAALAAFGLAVAVPGAAGAAPSATSDQVTAQGTWVYLQSYGNTTYGRYQCKMDTLSTKYYDDCFQAPNWIERKQYFA